MERRAAVMLELAFLIASVLVFRSLWALLDRYTLSSSLMHVFLLVSGLAISVVCIYLFYAKK